MSSVQDFIYIFDLRGRFTYVNQSLLDLWQKDLAGAVGKNFYDLDYPQDLAARLQRQIQEVITTRRPLKDETPYTSAFGTRGYEYIFVPLISADGAVEAVAGVTRDITERKRATRAGTAAPVSGGGTVAVGLSLHTSARLRRRTARPAHVFEIVNRLTCN